MEMLLLSRLEHFFYKWMAKSAGECTVFYALHHPSMVPLCGEVSVDNC
jgi:hypothetical protein